MTHRIRRQILDIELPREAGAVALQRRIGRVYLERVLPELERLFNRMAPADRFLQIRRLEIDLGQLNEANWEQAFVERCLEQVARRINEIPFEPDGARPANAVLVGPEAHALDALRYFLETGVLPWYARGTALAQLETMLTEMAGRAPGFFRRKETPMAWEQATEKVPGERANGAEHTFLALFRHNDAALQRLVWQFSPAFATLVVESALGFAPGWIGHAAELYRSQTGRNLDAAGRLYFLRALLRTAPDAWRGLPPSAQLLAPLFSGQPAENTLQMPEQPDQPSIPAMRAAGLESSDPQEAGLRAAALKRFTPPVTTGSAPGQAPAGARESIPVDNAGLVLLAVYLPAFFDALELTDGKIFKVPALQYRAVHLLHFLATGVENPEEPALAMPKILCGMDLETPVPAEVPLPETDKSEAIQLLEAVIRNWPLLKNTGPDGLRQAFLQRSGLLGRMDSGMGWLLRPERLGQDILLEQLPWTYSVIRLPWMETIMQVEW